MSTFSIADLLNIIRSDARCIVKPASALPASIGDTDLPADIIEFYKFCGGVTLFDGQPFQIDIVAPEDFVRANPVIVGEPCEDDRSYDWFIVANDNSGQYVTVDLAAASRGRCYDSFWDKHGLPGSNPIIANSFTDLIHRLIVDQGQRFYWLESTFVPLGDAYDNMSAIT